MSTLNGWYKNLNVTVHGLYQFTAGALEVNISKYLTSGEYSGMHYTGIPPTWVAYSTQAEMDAIWVAQFATATPLP